MACLTNSQVMLMLLVLVLGLHLEHRSLRAVSLTPDCTYQSPGYLVKMRALIKRFCGGAGIAGLWPHFEWQRSRVHNKYYSRRKTSWNLKWALKHG